MQQLATRFKDNSSSLRLTRHWMEIKQNEDSYTAKVYPSVFICWGFFTFQPPESVVSKFFPQRRSKVKREGGKEGRRESWVAEGSSHGPATRWGFVQLGSEELKNLWKFPEPQVSPGCRLTWDGREREAEKAERTPLSWDLAPRASPLSSTANFQNTALACPPPSPFILK